MQISEEKRYSQLQRLQGEQWEKTCLACGACCGIVEGDPCEHLREASDGKYRCGIYENRFGVHKTRSGREMKCVPIRTILHTAWPGGQKCGYKIIRRDSSGPVSLRDEN